MNENRTKSFTFLNPIRERGAAAGITPNFPFGAGRIDFTNFKKNIPQFEELATSFGLQAAHRFILDSTLSLAQSKTTSSRPQPQFQPEPGEFDDAPLEPIQSNNPASLGFAIYSDLSIEGGTYRDNQGKVIGTYPDIQLPAVLFEVTRENNLILTDIQGRDNSVIEYISAKSWKINCRGRVMSGRVRNTYPRTAVDNLKTALNSNVPLKVNSWYLNMFGIYNIVIENRQFHQEEGSMEYQLFEFNAIADNPIVLKLSK